MCKVFRAVSSQCLPNPESCARCPEQFGWPPRRSKVNAEASASPLKSKVNRDVLADAATWATKTLPNRPPAPVLTGLLSTAAARGTVLVSGRLLADISKALPNQEVTLEQIDAKVDVTCGSSRFSLMTMPVAEYPALPQVPEDSGTVSAGEFQNAVSQVTIATSKDD